MPLLSLTPASKPTFYFIGVTTAQSSIMRVFPRFAEAMELGDVVIKGIDLKLHAPDGEYREVVAFLKNDPLSLGALVTTHKLDLFRACKDLFDYIDPYAELLGEVSCISKRDGKFRAHAKDPISSGLALEAFIPEGFWATYGGEALLLGAGGSSLAMSLYFANKTSNPDIPNRITIANRSMPRLDSAQKILSGLGSDIKFRFIYLPKPEDNDALIAELPPHSLIVNATGLGKDAPGSPTTDAVDYPHGSLVWEINYRGDLIFMWQAAAQAKDKALYVEDGWTYFIHGWTQVIAEVFGIGLDASAVKLFGKIARNI